MQTEDESTNRLSSIFIHYSKVFFILRLTFFVKLSYYTVFVLAFTFSEFSPIHIFHIFTFSTIASYSHFFTTMFTRQFCRFAFILIFTYSHFSLSLMKFLSLDFTVFYFFTNSRVSISSHDNSHFHIQICNL